MVNYSEGVSKFFLFTSTRDEKEVGRASLFLIKNNLHEYPYGLMEDVWVDEAYRSRGIGAELVKAVLEMSKQMQCYKLIATSRHKNENVHKLYIRLGFTFHGYEFRINL